MRAGSIPKCRASFVLAFGTPRVRNPPQRPNPMNYSELIQLYFERSNALQAYWTLYVVIIGGLLAFSSLRKHPAALATLIVSVLFLLFAYENHGAIQVATRQRLATLEAIKQSSGEAAAAIEKGGRGFLEPTLQPATPASVSTTHVVSDLLTIAGLWAMEFRRRKLRGAGEEPEDDVDRKRARSAT